MPWPEPITLSDPQASLEPLSLEHHDGLVRAAEDGELWNLWYTSVPEPQGMQREIARRLDLQQHGSMLPFTVFAPGGVVAGMTTYMNIDAANRRLEIGSTWYAASLQRSALNTACKWLLLSHAFEDLGCIAVEFRTSFHNRQSRGAIERLGAKLDGVLRNHQYHQDGTLRDTCVYSIIQSEWPTTKKHLQYLRRSHSTAAGNNSL